jgi:DNA-binding transcriptional LysR family regulator
MYISQPSISRAIKELEAQLGVTLFYRNTKSVELTDAGETILEQAQQIVSSFNNITAKLQGLTKLQTGKIHIGLPPITGVTNFSHLLGAFKKEYPEIQIHLYEFGSKKIESAILEGLLDIGICTPPDDGPIYETLCLVQDPLYVIMHAAHALAQQGAIEYKMLKDEKFILYDRDFRLHDMIIDTCREAGFVPNIVFETSQLELMTQMVEANFGIALLPSKICQLLDAGSIISRPFINASLDLQLAIVWKKDRYLSHAAREFLMFAKSRYNSCKSYIS